MADASPIRHVKLMAVYVNDQDAALAFYTGALGFTLTQDVTYRDGTRWLEVTPPGAVTGLTLALADGLNEGVVGGFTKVVLTTTDIDAAHRDLSAAGARFNAPPMRTDELPPMAFFDDPDGNRFLLLERDD